MILKSSSNPSFCRMIVSISASSIIFTFSSSRTTSLSRMISFLSIVTTSPVSSSTKSSVHFLKTLAANLLPIAFLRLFLLASISSDKPKMFRISLSESKPIALKRVVTGNFFFLSMYANITLLMSVANSIHAPLNGITLAE